MLCTYRNDIMAYLFLHFVVWYMFIFEGQK